MTMRGHNERAYRLDMLANDVALGFDRVEQGEENTIGGWLAVGHAMNEARSLFNGNVEFGQWLRSVNLSERANDHDRAAAMWAAANADQFEEARQRGNPRTIRGIHAKWKEIEAEREAEARAKEAEEQACKATAEEPETSPTHADPAATGKAFENGTSGGGESRPAPATEPEPDRSHTGAGSGPEENAAPDPNRKGLSSLSREGLEDEVAGLRAALADEIDRRKSLEAERDDLKARIRDLSEANQGRAISRLHAQIVSLKGAQKDAMAKAAKETRRANFFEAELKKARKSLEGQEVEI